MKQGFALTFLVAAFVMSGCKTGSAQSTPTSTAAETVSQAFNKATASGALPKLDTSADVAGPDNDRNGVRDDIDSYIAGLTFTNIQKASLRQESAALTLAITSNAADATAVSAANMKLIRGVNCVLDSFDASTADKVSDDIKKFTLNTQTRVSAYAAFSDALAGTTGSLPQGNTCETQ